MFNRRSIALSLVFACFGIICGLLVVRYLNSSKPTAGLKVESSPQSLVYINNVQVGRTPLDKMFPPGEVSIKLVPESTSSALSPYQTKVNLTNKVYTVIRREFGTTEDSSSGEILSLQPQSADSATLSVISSQPDSASVSLDNQPQGFSPLIVNTLMPADHSVEVSAPGYFSRTVNLRAVSGYKLFLSVKLAAKEQASSQTVASVSPTPSPSAGQLQKPYVEILETPVGFLRVRETPSVGGKEIGQVKPGEKYKLLESQSGWYRIQESLNATDSGWISSQYAKKFE